MTHMQFQAMFAEGGTVEFVPTGVKPLDISDLWRTLSENVPTYAMNFLAKDTAINGEPQGGTASINAKINFHESPSPFALVQGGWLPMPLVIPQQFLVDRNVVSHLRTISNGISNQKLKAFEWWMKFFTEGAATFNPLPYAWEGNQQRSPTFNEFISLFNTGAAEIKTAIPKCNVVQYGPNEFHAAYQMLLDFAPRTRNESRFLMSVCPILFERVKRESEKDILERIIQEAIANDIRPMSIVVVAAASCLYDDVHGKIFSIGRKLLKPKPIYSSESAFNAVADIRHLEIASAGQIYFGDKGFALSTCDTALASLWCALSPTGTISDDQVLEFTLDLTEELFPRLKLDEIELLRDRLAN